jgi:UDP-N-acetylmuramoyl-L-alanyl-D-glutamate--2,6-diaminopimelate ligase
VRIDLNKFTGVKTDSREVQPGDLFIACKGQKFNGEDFIPAALAAGAKAIIVSEEFSDSKIDADKLIKVKNPRKVLAQIAAQIYELQPENIVAVTGTNGKTSTVNFFRQICNLVGYNSASMGTLGIIAEGISNDNDDAMTSPDPMVLHAQLAMLFRRGITHLAIEASSHGLSQYRLDGVNIKAAGFTNFTHDHLDYHGNMHEYFNAKARLFVELLAPGSTAVLNADIEQFAILEGICKRRRIDVISYGRKAKHLKLLSTGDNIALEAFGKRYEEKFNLAGDFQYHNVLCALGLAVAIGLPADEIMVYISSLKAACGRLENIATFQGAQIYIDYAHTPDALEKALTSLKPICKGKLYVLFGAGGDRDPSKRPIMGKIAAEHADYSVITDDNPRTEDPSKIRKEILASCANGKEYDDRTLAIKNTMSALKKGDILLIAGKGHETYQIIGTEKVYYSDHEIVRGMLK